MRILIAPQEFKGSLTAPEAAVAIAAGIRRVAPNATLDVVPLADGGPGTLDALLSTTEGVRCTVTARDPLGRVVDASFGLLDGGSTALIESAEAAGLLRLTPDERDPLGAGTEGVGDLIGAALDAGARRLVIGLGGSATNDGGAGMARALGVRLLDRGGAELPSGGAALAQLAALDLSGIDPRLAGVDVRGATDVRNPLCGPNGASAVYGPQKGAGPEEVARLDRALVHYADLLAGATGRDVRDTPGAGAAGGLGAGLLAFLDARLESGFSLIAGALDLGGRMQGCDLVLTGEGRLDGQSVEGKTTTGVAQMASQAGIPCVVLCGGLASGWERALDHGVTAAFSIADGSASIEEMQTRASEMLERTAEQVVRLWRR